jgi:hypothetical protein
LKWNSLHFGNIHKQINDTLKLLDITQKTTPSHSSFELEISLKVDLDNLLIKEESLWRSKSRESWLTCKDLNTKYFHLSTLIRRSNAVNFLKLDSGVWVSSRTEIGDHFSAHFTNIFTSTNPHIEPEMQNLFTPFITEEENDLLCSIPAKEEIWMHWPVLVLQRPRDLMALLPSSLRSIGKLLEKMSCSAFGFS